MGAASLGRFSLVWRLGTIVCHNFRTRELQCRDRVALFGQTAFEIPLFGIAQLGLEQTLIAIDISQMCTQTGNSLFHNTLSCIHKPTCSFKVLFWKYSRNLTSLHLKCQYLGTACDVSCRLALKLRVLQIGKSHAQLRFDCDPLSAGASDVRLVFRGPRRQLCLAQGEDLFSCGIGRAVPQDDRPYSRS